MPLGIPNFVSNLFSSLKKTNISEIMEMTEGEERGAQEQTNSSSNIINPNESNKSPSTSNNNIVSDNNNPEANLNIPANSNDDKIQMQLKASPPPEDSSAGLNQEEENAENNKAENKEISTLNNEQLKENVEKSSSGSEITDRSDTLLIEDKNTSSSVSNRDLQQTSNLNSTSDKDKMENEENNSNTGDSYIPDNNATTTIPIAIISSDKIEGEEDGSTQDDLPVPVDETAAVVEVMDIIETEEEVTLEGEETELETETGGLDVFSESVTEQEDTEAEPGLVTDMEIEEKENGEEVNPEDFGDENEGDSFMEITRRRVSQDRDGNCYW